MIHSTYKTTCCIVGGGPAGMMVGYLLARSGVEVIVLEKHKDFFRDFRGDTIHPSTFEIIYELGFLDEFLQIPHQEIKTLGARYNGTFLTLADFSHLSVAKPALGLMPQWDFLNFLREKAKQLKNFRVLMETKFSDLVIEEEKVKGVIADTNNGSIIIRAGLVIGADGRDSSVREKAGLKVISKGVPIDVLWFKLSKQSVDPDQTLGNFTYGKLLVMLDRNDYWQCGYIISKGGFEELKEKGIQFFKNELTEVAPFLGNRMTELKDWEQVRLLTVTIDYLEKWHRQGLLCIGDAAHAMSPIGGVGINLALQDAVATANLLYRSLLHDGFASTQTLSNVRKRRTFPVRVTQTLQIIIQKAIVSGRTKTKKTQKPPFIMRMLNRYPFLRRFPARLIGIGIRPEHIKTPGTLS